MESSKLSFELIPEQVHAAEIVFSDSDLIQKHQMVYMHVMVVFVNCDLSMC